MKRKIMAVVLASALCAGMVFPAAAESGGGGVPALDGTDIYAGVTLEDPDAKVKVEVPTMFAFVVNGTVTTTDTTAVASALTLQGQAGKEPTILLPNIKVKVDTQDANGKPATYHLETVASGNWKFVNYSTRAKKMGDTTGVVDDRVGLGVKVLGSIRNEGTEASRNQWTHIANADDASMKGNTAGYKKFTLEVNDQKFSDVQADGSFAMAAPVELAAPDLAGGVDPVTGYAIVGNQLDTTFNVYIGGQRSQYKAVEESAKVGTIVWTIQLESQNVTTGP